MSSPAEAGPSGERGLLSGISTLLQILAGAAVAVSALGFPAVTAQLYRFNVPLDYLAADQAIRAGILPALVLVIGSAYVFLLVRTALFVLPLVVPIGAILYGAVLIGLLAYTLVITWAFIWLPAQVVGLFVAFDNRDLLFAAAAIDVVVGVGWLAVRLNPKLAQLLPRGVRRFTDPSRARRERLDPDREASPRASEASLERTDSTPEDAPAPPPRQGSAEDQTADSHELQTRDKILIGVASGGMVIAFAYCLKLVAHLFDPKIGAAISTPRIFSALGIASVVALFLAALVIGATDVDTPEKRSRGLRILISTFATLYVAGIGAYAWKVYPELPQRVSGGRPEAVIVWLREDDLPVGVRHASSRVRPAVEGDWVRLDGLFLLSATSERVILVDAKTPPSTGFVIPRENVKALAWKS